MSKQEKRAKTLIEYMGFKDSDLFLPDHDTWCLKLLNPKLVRKILESHYNLNSKKILKLIKLTNRDGVVEYVYDYGQHIGDYQYKNIQRFAKECRISYVILNEKLELEHVLTKHGYNGYSQRLGFVDVFYWVKIKSTIEFTINGTTNKIENSSSKEYVLFFEVKVKKQTIGSITREVEYYRDVINEIYHTKVKPIVVSPEKIPINQFDSMSFEEILHLEKEVKMNE